jgi:hypothetical protein
VEVACVVVWVPQVVHGVDERLVESPESAHQFAELLRSPGIEAEVKMEDVEVIAMIPDPGRVECGRRPPLGLGYVRRDRRVSKPGHAVVHPGHREMSNIDMPCGYGQNPQEAIPAVQSEVLG